MPLALKTRFMICMYDLKRDMSHCCAGCRLPEAKPMKDTNLDYHFSLTAKSDLRIQALREHLGCIRYKSVVRVLRHVWERIIKIVSVDPGMK
jgi:hypothetical protein